jgi:AcrR family transcriptional regulator
MSTPPGRSVPVQQRARDTRVRILDAAVDCLAEVGYARTTTTEILRRAGVSRGSLLHQFPFKDELLVAAVQHLAEVRIAEFVAELPHREDRNNGGGHSDHADVPDDRDDIDRAVERLWAVLHGPLFRATLELWVAARTNPPLREVLGPEEHRLGSVIRKTIAADFGSARAAHPRFRELGSLLWSSMRGVALTYTFEPRDHRHDPHLAAWKNLAHSYLE